MTNCTEFKGMPTTDRCANCGCNKADHFNQEQDKTLEDMIFINLSCTEELTKEFIKIALEDIKTFDRKQHDYGSGNIGDFGEYGVLVRANDKMQRLKNLVEREKHPAYIVSPDKISIKEIEKEMGKGGEVAVLSLLEGALVTKEPLNENVSDSWLDLSVYGIIARMCRNGVWPK